METKTTKKTNGVASEGEIQQGNAAARDKLKLFLDKEGLAIEGYFQCLNQEVLKEFQESPFVKMNLVSTAVRVIKIKK